MESRELNVYLGSVRHRIPPEIPRLPQHGCYAYDLKAIALHSSPS